MKIVVDHLGGTRRGQRQELELRSRLRFGRHPDNEVAFDTHRDLDASARHAELRVEADGVWLVDVGSSNGTFVGVERVVRHPVTPGVELEVSFGGAPTCRLWIGEEGSEPPPRPRGGARQHGARTVAMMVQHALVEAQARHGVRRSTQFIRSMVDQSLHRSTRRFRIAAALTVVVVAAVVAGLLWRNEQMARRLRQERADAETRAATIAAAQAEQQRLLAEGPGPRLVRENREAVYLLAHVDRETGRDRAFCSAFAVSSRQLATNAHCVAEATRLRGEGSDVWAVKNGDATRRYPVGALVAHPAYTGSRVVLSTDVGLIEVGQPLPATVRLADPAHLEALATGTRVFIYGFPVRLADPARPEATLTEGVIGRITKLSGEVGDFEDNLLVQHDAFTAGGTSGSPVLDASGAVIAVNAGGYVGQQRQIVAEPNTGRVQVVDVGTSLAGYNYGIRIDALRELMSNHEAGSKGAAP